MQLHEPSDPHWPVSIKGVLGWDGRYVVARNPRGEWELPGGRIEPEDADAPSTLRREISEELGITVTVGSLIDTWIYTIDLPDPQSGADHGGSKRVFIVTYRCHGSRSDDLRLSEEHSEVALMTIDQLRTEPIPGGYLRSIETAAALEFGAVGMEGDPMIRRGS